MPLWVIRTSDPSYCNRDRVPYKYLTEVESGRVCIAGNLKFACRYHAKVYALDALDKVSRIVGAGVWEVVTLDRALIDYTSEPVVGEFKMGKNKYAKVVFLANPSNLEHFRGAEYLFNVPESMDLIEGDKVLVSCATGLQVAKVRSTVEHECTGRATAWIVSKVDFSDFNREQQKAERLRDLQRVLSQKKKELHKRFETQWCCEADKGFAELFAEFEALGGKDI